MAKWFQQAAEIDRLRAEVKRQAQLLEQLSQKLGSDQAGMDIYGVSTEELALIAEGKQIPAIKHYRERTGADLVTAKNAIDSVQR